MEGETYRVRLLIGKAYDVESSQPVDVVAKSDERIVVSDVEPNSFTVVVHPTPSNVVLRCEVRGGTYGGRLTIALNEAGRRKIARVGGNLLPNNVEIPPDTTRVFETEYTPLEPSGWVNDIVAEATFVEDFTHNA